MWKRRSAGYPAPSPDGRNVLAQVDLPSAGLLFLLIGLRQGDAGQALAFCVSHSTEWP